ncbi:hypothetical protein Tco_0460596, partial [Tanacetum coccineum]
TATTPYEAAKTKLKDETDPAIAAAGNDAEIRNQGVSAVTDPAGIDSAVMFLLVMFSFLLTVIESADCYL